MYDANANTAFRTQFDVGDALDAALRMVGAAIRLRRLLTPLTFRDYVGGVETPENLDEEAHFNDCI